MQWHLSVIQYLLNFGGTKLGKVAENVVVIHEGQLGQ